MIGGAVGVLAMGFYEQKISPLLVDPNQAADADEDKNAAEQPLHSIAIIGIQHHKDESSTAALGRILYEQMAGKEPQSGVKSLLSNAIHWSYGIAQGGIYGLARADVDGLDLLGGSAFGLGLWLFGDELVVPLLGLQDGPTAYSSATHTNRLAMHVVYGATTALVTKVLQSSIE